MINKAIKKLKEFKDNIEKHLAEIRKFEMHKIIQVELEGKKFEKKSLQRLFKFLRFIMQYEGELPEAIKLLSNYDAMEILTDMNILLDLIKETHGNDLKKMWKLYKKNYNKKRKNEIL